MTMQPEALYVWLVPSEDVFDQPGSWRIRKWDTEPFPEANFMAEPCDFQPARKKMGFAAAVREYGDNWLQAGFAWNGTSYRGMSAATAIAMDESRGPDDRDAFRMRNCERYGRMYQVNSL